MAPWGRKVSSTYSGGEKSMAEEKQIPLDELLFGPKPDPRAKPESTLAKIISVWYREGLARSFRGQAAQRSALPKPLEEP